MSLYTKIMTDSNNKLKITYVNTGADGLSAYSGMNSLQRSIDSSVVIHKNSSRTLKKRSWRLGHSVEVLSNLYYGSSWNYLVPVIDELKLYNQIDIHTDLLSFLWGEFSTPSHFSLFRKKAQKIIGTFHCSQRRQWRVTMKPRWYLGYDHITLMSDTQRDYFIDNGYPEKNMTTILHGVDIEYFVQKEGREVDKNKLNLFLVGSTERDHRFAAEVLMKLDSSVLCKVATASCYHHFYKDVKCVELLPRVSDDELVRLYQNTDLLFMPMLDCTANNAILESMACGTPVMVNCVGGIPEYVDTKCNFVMIGKKVDEWVGLLKELNVNRDRLLGVRPKVRAWAERFDWNIIAKQYLALYERVLGD